MCHESLIWDEAQVNPGVGKVMCWCGRRSVDGFSRDCRKRPVADIAVDAVAP